MKSKMSIRASVIVAGVLLVGVAITIFSGFKIGTAEIKPSTYSQVFEYNKLAGSVPAFQKSVPMEME